MPSHRASFPSLDGTIVLSFYSYLLLRSRKKGSLQARAFPSSPRWLPCTVIYRWSSSGLPGSWGVLSHLCPAHETPAASLLPLSFGSVMLPPLIRRRRPRRYVNFEADSHSFSARCLRFQIRISLHWQDSLPVGDSPYRMGLEPIRLR